MTKPSSRKRLLYSLFAACIPLLWLTKALNSEKTPPPFWAVPLGSAAIFLTVYLSPLMVLIPRKVKIRRDGIKIEGVIEAKLWKYKTLCDYHIESQTINDEVFKVLCITSLKGSERRFGIDPAISLDELEKILSEKLGHRQDPEVILRGKKLEG